MMDALEGSRVCVIGSGISGLSAAWLLHRNGARVTLLESEESLGGHTLTDRTSPFPVDLGFQVYNLTTYPHFVGFLETLGVDTQPSDMSFALSMDGGKLEWGSDNLDTIFAQRANMCSVSFLSMLRDVIRFGKEGPKVLDPANLHVYREMTLGNYLTLHKYSQAFTTNYVVPMCAAVWSVPNAQVLQFPIQMLVRFWINHHLLDITQRPLWRVVKGRSQEYVKRVCAELPDVRTSTPALGVKRVGDGVEVTMPQGTEHFDDVVFATHSDITLRILGQDARPEERDVLAAIPYNDNEVILHTDASLMPANRKVWASWNFLGSSSQEHSSKAVCVTYWANRLQEMPPGAPDLFVTLNAIHPPVADKVIRNLTLSHPVFSFASVEAQAKLPGIQGKHRAWFAGAWAGYGFHEDGIRSAVAVVEAMGGSLPWEPRAVSPKVTMSQQLFLGLFDRFARATFTTGKLRIILPTGYELHYGAGANTVLPQVPEGELWRGRPALEATLRVFNMDMFRKIVLRHDVGLGEAYMGRDFEVLGDPGGLMAVLVANAISAEEQRGRMGLLNWLGTRLLYLAHLRRPNTIEGSRKNIEEHYDAGNAMYKVFLDESLTYSSGVYRSPNDSLHQAQLNKIDALVEKADIGVQDHVLEIGCGWGGFAIRAVQTTGCRWTGITVSKEQLAEATERVAAAGLSDRITLLFCDYRDVCGQYDKVVSVEMIEAVGHDHLKPYFQVIGRVLKPGGKAVLQAISSADERYEVYCASSDFIREHIFPGGHLPSLGSVVEACRGTGLVLRDTHDIGPDYAVTLRSWRKAWEERREDVLRLGYSDRFWRKYRFYFVYCEAAFDSRYIHNYHLLLVKDPAAATPAAATQPAGAVTAVHSPTMSLAASASSAMSHMAQELPSDPITQVLLGLYFFLAGMLVRSHPHMWLLPVTSCLMAAFSALVHAVSGVASVRYRFLTPEQRAWWCTDIAHLAYSGVVSLWALSYVAHQPAALSLVSPPQDTRAPSTVIAAAAGVFAFLLWACVRARLYRRTLTAMVQYTLLLSLFGTATFKDVALPLLAALLASEVYSVAFLAGKLQDLAGMGQTPARRLMRHAERATLVAFRLMPHAVMTLVVLASASAFSSVLYYAMCLLCLAFLNYVNCHKAWLLFAPAGSQAHKQHSS